ncbi:hypothetical protein KSS87_002660 [Heliosperma pusillum]|nr:hypothetical protein KSS87_002660 [Heliosperma pusillum]
MNTTHKHNHRRAARQMQDHPPTTTTLAGVTLSGRQTEPTPPQPPSYDLSLTAHRLNPPATIVGSDDDGKVHGSLARAGKVRGQTPKVAKQDKKKKPRGRAHKRLQYNRRFVTAVVGFGKKRGPNSSEK